MKKILIASIVLITVLFFVALAYEAIVSGVPVPSPSPATIEQNAAPGVSKPDEQELEEARREFIIEE